MLIDRCHVHVALPGSTDLVNCGSFETVDRGNDGVVGRFSYDAGYLARKDKVEIDPVRLGLVNGAAKEHVGDSPLFPSLRDASPDAWGRLLVERALGECPSEVGHLVDAPDDRAGALVFSVDATPPEPRRAFHPVHRLGDLMEVVDDVIRGDMPNGTGGTTGIDRLRGARTAMGGARPKITVEDDDGLWLAKFGRADDGFDNPRVEHAMLLLAAQCGLMPAHSKLVTVGGRSVLLVRRFDREKVETGYLRHRTISAVTFLDASDSPMDRARWSYPLLADELRRHDADQANSRLALFRRMTFNALISNVDDHPRNHALIADGRGWRLSPAYDLVPTPLVAQDGRCLAMQVGSEGRLATRANILSEAPRFGLSMDDAGSVVDAVHTVVSLRWHPLCREVGVSVEDCERIRSAFDYPGFDRTCEDASEPSGSGM